MSDYTAIADVSYTFIDLLRDNMGDLIDPDSIVVVSPGEIESNDNVRLSLFLFQVIENVHMKNQEMQIIDPAKLKYPPLIMDLSYMLTSYPSSGIQDITERTMEEHSILGKAMQVIHDNSIIADPFLRGCLTDDGQELHISQTPLNLDDMTKIWSTFKNMPFRPSVCYLVSNVRIESTREKEAKRVTDLKFDRYMKV